LQALSRVDMDILPLMDVIPTSSEFNDMLSSTSTDPIDASLAVIEPLASPSTTSGSVRKARWNRSFDRSGFSPYARGVTALLHILTTDRYVARENLWTLQHILTLALFASEVLQIPGADSPAFRGKGTAVSELKDIIRLTQQVNTLLLTTTGEGSWHQDVVDGLLGKALARKLDSVGDFVRLVFQRSKLDDAVRDSLVLRTVLQHVLRNVTKEDADRWIELARGIEGQGMALRSIIPETVCLNRRQRYKLLWPYPSRSPNLLRNL
jgi:E3 ubiquitin-protein ligase listerin